ncbi:MAG: hypothetical protein WBZ29_00335 [Methanocella sp.]
MSNKDCPYKLAGICMNTVSMLYDESCCPGFCLFYNHMAEKREVGSHVKEVRLSM